MIGGPRLEVTICDFVHGQVPSLAKFLAVHGQVPDRQVPDLACDNFHKGADDLYWCRAFWGSVVIGAQHWGTHLPTLASHPAVGRIGRTNASVDRHIRDGFVAVVCE